MVTSHPYKHRIQREGLRVQVLAKQRVRIRKEPQRNDGSPDRGTLVIHGPGSPLNQLAGVATVEQLAVRSPAAAVVKAEAAAAG